MTKIQGMLLTLLFATAGVSASFISSSAQAAIGCLPGHCGGQDDNDDDDLSRPQPLPDTRQRFDEVGTVTYPVLFCNTSTLSDAESKAVSAARAIVKANTGASNDKIQYGNDQITFMQCGLHSGPDHQGEITVTVKAWFLVGERP